MNNSLPCVDLRSSIDSGTNACTAHAAVNALAQRTLAYAQEAGLVKALMQTAGATNDEGLIDWMVRQGDLGFAICRLAGLAEGRK